MSNISQRKDWSGYGIVSLCLATGAFVSAPFLLLLSLRWSWASSRPSWLRQVPCLDSPFSRGSARTEE